MAAAAAAITGVTGSSATPKNCRSRTARSMPDVYEWGREREIVRCPWHGYEFNLSDGKSVIAPALKLRARVYQIDIEGEEVPCKSDFDDFSVGR
jgi:nitrite reductase/ring-hydroxylating ferredoxin subunit